MNKGFITGKHPVSSGEQITFHLVSWTFPMMAKSSYLVSHFNNGFAYWVYGVMGVLTAAFMWKPVSETKGKTLEELELLWHSAEPELLQEEEAAN